MTAESDGREAVVTAEPRRAGERAGGSECEGGGKAAPGGLGSRAPRFIKRSRPLHLSWQAAVFLVGLGIVGAGVVMLPLPGPGWFVIFAGMAVWATEFVWAQLVLRWTRRKVAEAAQRALDPGVRRRNLALAAVGVVVVGAGAGYYVWLFGLVMPWNIG